MQNKVPWSNTMICASDLTGPPASSSYDVYCFRKVLLELITGNFGVRGTNDADSDERLARTLGRHEVRLKYCKISLLVMIQLVLG
jgi:hypothetical protein